MKNLFFTICVLLSSLTFSFAQKTDQEIGIALKENSNMKIFVDGKEFDFPLELIKEEHLASVEIVKGEIANKKYNAPEGVILIQTKDLPKLSFSDAQKDEDNSPLFFVNGKEYQRTILDEISPDDIEAIEVIKGERAINEFNAPNGVILIKTKDYKIKFKKKKKKNKEK